MYKTLSAGHINTISKSIKPSEDTYPLQHLVDIIFKQLKHLRSISTRGSVLNEIIERTEVVAFNIQRKHPTIYSDAYFRDYQKNLWQQLVQLREAEYEAGNEIDLDEQKMFFYHLFNYMDRLIIDLLQSQNNEKYMPALNHIWLS